MQLSQLSLMPEGQFSQMSADEQRDLIAYLASPVQVPLRGPKSAINPQTEKVPDVIEGEAMKLVGKTDGNISTQQMYGFPKDKWSGNAQLWWTGAKPGSLLELELPVAHDGEHHVEVVLTMAIDYGIVQLTIDGEEIGPPIDGYFTDVITTGVLNVGQKTMKGGTHKLGLKIVGANPKSEKAYMVGLDYIKLVRRTDGNQRQR
jgi:hypothetical protein